MKSLFIVVALFAGAMVARAQCGSSGKLIFNPLTGLPDCTGSGGGSGSGTVTSVSVTTANGVSGSVATATTTPAITLTLGAITPTTVNGNTITTGTGVLTLGAGKTLTASNSLTLAGTDSTVMTFPGTTATIARTDAAQTFTGVQTFSTPLANASVAAAPVLTPGTSGTLVAPRGYMVCTGACTVTVPVPAAGNEFCIMNDDNVATAITLSALGSSAMYENSARTAYGTAGTGTLVVAAAAANKVCIVGRDTTHYFTVSNTGGAITVN